jgi:non-heme chloroperoxidase
VHACRHDQGPQAGRLKPCKGFPHGMPTTHADTITADLLACIKG